MSLDVYLTIEGIEEPVSTGHIFIRENGQTKEITRAEWDERFPDQEPLIVKSQSNGEVYTANITHNLNRMASEAGIYEYLWRPDENNISKAGQLLEPLRKGLALLESDPERFKEFNPPNGWGDYETLLEFTRGYLKACEEYPDASVSVWG